MNGLIVGTSTGAQTQETRNRYYQPLLDYTLVFPDEWELSETTTTVAATSMGVGRIEVEVQRLQDNIEPRIFIRDNMGIPSLQKSEPLEQFRLIGHTGIAVNPETGKTERVAAIYYGPRVFIIRGEIYSTNIKDDIDALLLGSIRSFRAIQNGEIHSGAELKLKYVQASEFFDFAVVAKTSKIVNYPEETLRLLNGYYPSGSPDEGDWIKLIE